MTFGNVVLVLLTFVLGIEQGMFKQLNAPSVKTLCPELETGNVRNCRFSRTIIQILVRFLRTFQKSDENDVDLFL